MNLSKDRPGTRMPPEEWKATAAIRRGLVERLGHVKWSQMTVDQCDEAVREESRLWATKKTSFSQPL